MKNFFFWENIKTAILPHVLVIALFYIISVIFFYPVLEGKDLSQSDMTQLKGMTKETVDLRTKTGDPILWNNKVFGGMPNYFVSMPGEFENIYYRMTFFLRLFLPNLSMGILFVYLWGFYFLLSTMGVKRWLGFIGAIAFAFTSYNIVIITAGHVTQAYSMGYMPVIFAGFLLIFKKKYIPGLLVMTTALGVQLVYNHIQITYYTALALLVLFLINGVKLIWEKDFSHLYKSIAMLVIAVVVAVLPLTKKLWITYEYGEYTMRGGSELSIDSKGQASKGLEKEYALSWCNGIDETMTLLIPNFKGGSSNEDVGKSSNSFKALEEKGIQQPEQIIKSLPTYWGDMPFTSGPVYFGAIMCFLFVLGLFSIKGTIKWWVVSITILTVMLSWGSHFEIFSDLFFNYFPLYNKFRSVSMILCIPSVLMLMLAILAVDKIIKEGVNIKQLRISFFIVGGILLFFIVLSGMLYSFSAASDKELMQSGYPDWLVDAIREDRLSMLRSDAIRSLVLVGLVAGLLFLFNKKTIKEKVFYYGLVLLVFIDVFPIAKRYLKSDDFAHKKDTNSMFAPSVADTEILKDKSYFRVLKLQGPFSDGFTSYYHNSLGGYSAAKMSIYQDLINRGISYDMQRIISVLTDKEKQNMLYSMLQQSSVLNMLNTRYIIYNPGAAPIQNPFALGSAWFIDSIQWAPDAKTEMSSLVSINTANTAVVRENQKAEIQKLNPSSQKDSALIKMTSLHPDHIKYESSSSVSKLAVFSEVFYDKGWTAKIDGKESPIFRVNYLLRGLVVPAGKHEIQFDFEPKAFYLGKKINTAGSILYIILLTAGIFITVRKKKED